MRSRLIAKGRSCRQRQYMSYSPSAAEAIPQIPQSIPDLPVGLVHYPGSTAPQSGFGKALDRYPPIVPSAVGIALVDDADTPCHFRSAKPLNRGGQKPLLTPRDEYRVNVRRKNSNASSADLPTQEILCIYR
jgi:hypothetical protein